MSKTINSFLRYNRAWFDLNQESLLRLLNGRFTRGIARMLMRIRPCDISLGEPICQITPNSLSYGLRPVGDRWQITTDFRTHPKYAKRIYFAMRPFLALAHAFDIRIANPFRPAWNLGWDDATYYPQDEAADPQTTCDGIVNGRSTVSWNDLVRTVTTANAAYLTNTTFTVVRGDWNGTRYDCNRSAFIFDTSGLDDGASISAGTFSLYPNADPNTAEATYPANLCLGSVDLTNDYEMVVGDFAVSHWGSTAFASTYLLSNFTAGAYRNFSLNASGIAAISKTGNSCYGMRPQSDIDDNAPTDISQGFCCFADYTGSTRPQTGCDLYGGGGRHP